MDKYLIVGLGNPGAEYDGTRHNTGFMVLDAFAQAAGVSFDDRRYGFVAECSLKGRKVFLLKPTTYMNLSGNAVRYWLNKENIDQKRLLVVVDDLSLPLGAFRLKGNGSNGGHNGLGHIQQLIGQQYARLRMGIGNEFARGAQVDWVLGKYSSEDMQTLQPSIDTAVDMIKSFVLAGIDITMNQYNKLGKKDVLNDGDEVMIYRNGCAAADFDGMEQSHYLDVVAIASTSDVNDPDVLRFTLNKTADGFWTLTDQFGRKLGATGKQALAWNEGSTLWSIELGYDGATITNSNTAYGTLRYNEPTSGYTRFALYTSKSLPLPFLYLKGAQKQPSVTRSLTFESTEVTADVEEGHIVLKPEVQPSAVTDSRIIWTIDNSEVATVNGGYVTLLKEGTATITAAAYDGGAVATVHLTVTDNSGVESVTNDDNAVITRKVLEGSKIVIVKGDEKYDINGVICK